MSEAPSLDRLDPPAPTEEQRATVPSLPSRLRIGEFGWVWVGLLAVYVLSAVFAPGTMRVNSLVAAMPFTAILAIVAAGQTLVIQQRGLDLSVPGVVTIAAILMTKVGTAHDSALAGVAAALAVAAAVGLANGLIVTSLSITPLVATLATNAVLVGAAYAISGGAYTTATQGWVDFTRDRILGVPVPVLFAVALVAALAWVFRKSVFGRRFVAAGASPGAARAAGFRFRRYQIVAYVACSMCAALGAVLLAGVTGAATPDLGTPYLFAPITAVIVGGTLFTGGRGSLVATAGGALLLSQLSQLTLALGAPASTQLFVTAGALVLSVSLRYLSFGPARNYVKGRLRAHRDAEGGH